MNDFSYLVEERAPDGQRAMSVTLRDDFALVKLVFDNAMQVELSLDDLQFIGRGFGTLPDWVRAAEGMQGPQRMPSDKPVLRSAIAAPVENAAPAEAEAKPARNGARWTDQEDQKLTRAYCDANKTVLEIAREFGRTPASIVSRLLFLDLIQINPKKSSSE